MYPLLSMPEGSEWILILLVIAGISLISYRAGFQKGKQEGERPQLQRQLDQIRKKQAPESGSISSKNKKTNAHV